MFSAFNSRLLDFKLLCIAAKFFSHLISFALNVMIKVHPTASVKYHSFCSIPICGMYQMAAFNIQEALIWKEKIEMVIDQVRHVETLSCANSVNHIAKYH